MSQTNFLVSVSTMRTLFSSKEFTNRHRRAGKRISNRKSRTQNTKGVFELMAFPFCSANQMSPLKMPQIFAEAPRIRSCVVLKNAFMTQQVTSVTFLNFCFLRNPFRWKEPIDDGSHQIKSFLFHDDIPPTTTLFLDMLFCLLSYSNISHYTKSIPNKHEGRRQQ